MLAFSEAMVGSTCKADSNECVTGASCLSGVCECDPTHKFANDDNTICCKNVCVNYYMKNSIRYLTGVHFHIFLTNMFNALTQFYYF